MTVFENVLVGATFGAGHSGRAGTPVAFEGCATGLLLAKPTASPGPAAARYQAPRTARALATEPDLLLLDEIAGGLTEHEVATLIRVIEEIRAEAPRHLDRAHRSCAAGGGRQICW